MDAVNGAALPEGLDVPRAYQKELFEIAILRNTIIRMDTGTGKSLIAVMVIRWIKTKAPAHIAQKHVVFLVPTNPLVLQQAEYLMKHLPSSLKVKFFRGADNVDFWDHGEWAKQLLGAHCLVMTPQIYLNMLDHAYSKITEAGLLVFDEAHHARKDAPYNQIMQFHYHKFKADHPERSAELPKILGLTASPIYSIANALQSIQILESNLDSKIFECINERDSLAANTFRPRESVVTFAWAEDQVKTPFEVILMPLGLESFYKGGNFQTRKDFIKKELGQLGTDIWLLRIFKQLIKKRRLDGQEISSKMRNLYLSLKLLLSKQSVDAANSTPKLRCFLNLLASYQGSRDLTALVFVEQRHVCVAISKLIKRDPRLSFLRPGHLVGHAAGDSIASHSIRKQARTVKEMKAGTRDILICTSVAEEGLDFISCKLVVRFDAPKTTTSYVQSRGRARAQMSEMIFLAAEGSDEGRKIASYQRAEEDFKQYYAEEHAESQEQSEDSGENLSQYVLTDPTGAKITLRHAKPLLAELCSLLPRDKFTEGERKPVYEMVPGSAFRYTVLLPLMRYVRQDQRLIYGEPHRTKQNAEQSAAFRAIELLHAQGGFNEYLLPLRSKHSVKGIDADNNKIDQIAVEASVLDEVSDILCPLDSTAHLHCLEFEFAEYASKIGIVLGFPVQNVERLPLLPFALRDPPSMHLSYIKSISLDQEPRVALAWFSNLVVQLTCNRRQAENDDASLWNFAIAPLTEHLEVDWNLVRSPYAPFNKVDSPSQSTILLAPFVRRLIPTRFFEFRCFREDLSLSSPDEHHLRLSTTAKRRPFPSLKDLFEDQDCGYQMTDLRIDDTLVEVQLFPGVALNSNNTSSSAKDQQGRPTGVLPCGKILRSNLSRPFLNALQYLPAAVRCLRDLLIARRCVRSLRLPLNPQTLQIAITLPSCRLGYDYETFETIGDNFLKLAVSVHLFKTQPDRDEGQYSTIRSNSTDNTYLQRKALSMGLQTHFISETFDLPIRSQALCHLGNESRVIDVTYARDALSDVMEAIIGVAFIEGGVPRGLEVATILGLCTGGIMPWEDRQPPQTALDSELDEDCQLTPLLLALQEKLEYTFRKPQLLCEALTHVSGLTRGESRTHSYERLEFLGDTIIDLCVLSTLHARDPQLPPGQLTLLKSALVSNGGLAYIAMDRLELQKCIQHNSAAVESYVGHSEEELKDFDVEHFTRSVSFWDPPKPIPDCFEALIAAIFIDCGWNVQIVNEILARLYGTILSNLPLNSPPSPLVTLRFHLDKIRCRQLVIKTDEKQESVDRSTRSANGSPLVVRTVRYVCDWHGITIGRGNSTSQNPAKQRAAWEALKVLQGAQDIVCPCARANLDFTAWKCQVQAMLVTYTGSPVGESSDDEEEAGTLLSPEPPELIEGEED